MVYLSARNAYVPNWLRATDTMDLGDGVDGFGAMDGFGIDHRLRAQHLPQDGNSLWYGV